MLKAFDFALFGATWWPHASLERLRIVTYLVTWVCVLSPFGMENRAKKQTENSSSFGMMVCT